MYDTYEEWSDWAEYFMSTTIGKKISNDFENILHSPKIHLGNLPGCKYENDYVLNDKETPRQRLHSIGYCSILPFYYIEKLQSNNPTTIYDLGCGDNFFSNYYDNIIGLDANNGHYIDDQWINDRTATMEAFISFNGLSMQDPTNIVKYKNLLKDNGQGVITFSGQAFEPKLNDKDTEVTIRGLVKVEEYHTVDQEIMIDGATRIIFRK